jgi:hypothetical protein
LLLVSSATSARRENEREQNAQVYCGTEEFPVAEVSKVLRVQCRRLFQELFSGRHLQILKIVSKKNNNYYERCGAFA